MAIPRPLRDHQPIPAPKEGEAIPTEHFARIAFDKAQGRSSTIFWFHLPPEKEAALRKAGYTIEVQYEEMPIIFGENDNRKFVISWPDATT